MTTASTRKVAPSLHIGLAGDAPRSPSSRISLAGLDRIDICRGETRDLVRSDEAGVAVLVLTLDDARLSSRHSRLARLGTAWAIEDVGSKNGTWVGGQRITRRMLADGDAIVVGHTALVYREVGGDAVERDNVPAAVPGLATLCPALATRFEDLARAAMSTVAIEITGESGTGKELLARAVHSLSGRTGGFVAVNCGALPATLIEAELFGHKKGAFTGATTDRPGLVRSADGGTLFLDEVAELPASSQATLLRVLQEREVVPVGSDRPVGVDIRIVTATHAQLDAEVAAGRFRADLRARLLGAGIELPPLRDRREDLGPIASALLARLAPGRAVTFSADAVAALYTYTWPLNIRELERALESALAMANDRIELRHLPAAVRGSQATGELAAEQAASSDDQLRASLTASIARHDGNLAAVGRELGKDRTQIRRWMKRFGLSRGETE